MGKFLVKESKAGLRFNLVANNGEVIAASQVYKSASGCKNGIASVAKNAPVAVIEDQTVEGFKVEKHPKFEVYADKAGEFRFRLKATNGQIIAVSEGYKARLQSHEELPERHCFREKECSGCKNRKRIS